MRSLKLKVLILLIILSSAGCATATLKQSLDADQVAEQFMTRLQRTQHQEAYQLLSWQLTQNISFEQFDQLMQIMQEQWGRIEETQTVTMPFHKRLGESSFVSSSLPQEQVKRYIYEIKYEHAQMNCDLTLALQAGEYKIYWMSFWGSSVYMTPEIQGKMEELFSAAHPEETP